ncbi:MAG: hypothetical protein ACI81V_001271 [Lentimonas sp.]
MQLCGERVESFSGAEEFWATLDSRGSMKSIFGADLKELNISASAPTPLDFNWRVMNLILGKK